MKRAIRTSLVFALTPALLSLSAATFAASTSTTISPAEKAKIEETVHQYLLQKPEVILEALQILQKKQAEQAQQTIKETQQNAPKFADALFHNLSDPIGGNVNGKISIVEFFDYQCPHCIDMIPVMDSIIKANPNVRIVYKDYPIRGAMSEMAARAAIAANKQGKYTTLHTALMAVGKPLTEEIILQAAKNSGLNIEQLKKDMDDSTTTDQLKATVKLAQDLKLFGTPAFFVGKTLTDANSNISYAPGQMTQAQMQEIIDKTGK